MKGKSRQEVEKFVENQKNQLGLSEAEAQELVQQSLRDMEDTAEHMEQDLEFEAIPEPDVLTANASQRPPISAASARPRQRPSLKKTQDPYLSESQTIRARPTRTSKIRSMLYSLALPNEYIVQIGKKDAMPILGGKFFKVGKRFLKFPAAVQTVYFTSDNANKNYQGIKIDGYACWRVDPEKPDLAAKSLDFSDQQYPMGNTNRILRTICTEAIRHIIANQTIEEALTKKDEIGLNLKIQLERIEREWGIRFDQVGIERVTILSADVFDDLQQKARDELRLGAAESRMETDQGIERKKSAHMEEMEALRCHTEKEARILKATTESETRKVELEEQARREAEERKTAEARNKAENEITERAAITKADRDKRQEAREAEVEALKVKELRKLELARVRSEAEIKISRAADEAKIVSAQTESEIAKAEARHQQEDKELAMRTERDTKTAEAERQIAEFRLTAELQRDSSRFKHTTNQLRNKAQADHEIDVNRLERLKIEEGVKNLLAENRVLATFVEKLPEIASSLEIDRYTVLSGSGDSPLTHTLAQVLTLFEEHGLRRFLKPDKKGD